MAFPLHEAMLTAALVFVVSVPARADAADHLEYKLEIPAAAATNVPAIRVAVSLHRPSERGGTDAGVMGMVFSEVGIPAMWAVEPSSLQGALVGWTTDVFAAEGIAVTTDAGAPVLEVTVRDLWVSGYARYQTDLAFDLALRASAVAEPAWTSRLEGTISRGVLPSVTREIRKMFRQYHVKDEATKLVGSLPQDCLDLLLVATTERYREIARSPDLAAAIRNPAAPTTSSPNLAGCGKDTDCKGDRVCQAGACVEPTR